MAGRAERSLVAAPSPRARELSRPHTPVLMRVVNVVARPAARRIWPLEPEALKRSARRATGLREFGDDAPLGEPLAVLCRSVNEELPLHPLGRAAVTRLVRTSLVNRLRMEDLRRRRPALFEQPVPAPVVVTGLPRSGTTFLHRLLARHPDLYSAPFWELWEPVAAKASSPPGRADRRMEAGRRAVRMSAWMAPESVAIHELAHHEPEEEIIGMAPSFGSLMYEWSLGVPAFASWYSSTDQTPAYRYLRRVLQVMRERRPPGGRWVLKAPQHLEHLVPLLRVFPDATVVHTHREPVPAVVSLADYIAYAERTYVDRPDVRAVGRRSAQMVERLLRAAERDRDPADLRHVDVAFSRLRRDPVGVLGDICATAGLRFDAEVSSAVSTWLAVQQPGTRAVRPCSAADFGLDPDVLARRFAFYRPEVGW